jgi:cell wall-associated NlpC family hydrolase
MFLIFALVVAGESRQHKKYRTYPRETNARYGVVTASSVNLRKKASTSSTRLGRMMKGERFEIIGEEGEFWHLIYKGTKCYCMKEFTAEESSTPAPAPAPAPDPAPSQGYYTVKKNDLVCKSSSGRILCRLNKGCVVQVTGKSGSKSSIKLVGGEDGLVDTSSLSSGGSASAMGPSNPGMGAELVRLVKSKIGCPYVYGASGPDSFDCAGLLRWAYRQCGVAIKSGTNLQMAEGRVLTESQLTPGDAVYFGKPGETRSEHVGMYISPGKYIHAPHTGSYVQEADLTKKVILTVRRFY